MKWIAAAAVVLAIAAGAVAFLRDQESRALAAEVGTLKAAAQKLEADAKRARTEREAMAKELSEAKLAAQQLRSDLDSTKQFLEAERLTQARLREDLARMAERLHMAGRRPLPGERRPDGFTIEAVRPPPPAVIRAAPGGPTAIGVPQRAQ